MRGSFEMPSGGWGRSWRRRAVWAVGAIAVVSLPWVAPAPAADEAPADAAAEWENLPSSQLSRDFGPRFLPNGDVVYVDLAASSPHLVRVTVGGAPVYSTAIGAASPSFGSSYTHDADGNVYMIQWVGDTQSDLVRFGPNGIAETIASTTEQFDAVQLAHDKLYVLVGKPGPAATFTVYRYSLDGTREATVTTFQSSGFPQMFARPDVLVFLGALHEGFFVTYSGEVRSFDPYQGQPWLGTFASTYSVGRDGTVALVPHEEFGRDGCADQVVIVTHPDGTTWSAQVADALNSIEPGCSARSISALPDGRVVVTLSDQDAVHFVSYSATGTLIASHMANGPAGKSLTGAQAVADGDGLVLAAIATQETCQARTTAQCSNVYLLKYEGASVTEVAAPWPNANGAPEIRYGAEFLGIDGAGAFGDDAVALAWEISHFPGDPSLGILTGTGTSRRTWESPVVSTTTPPPVPLTLAVSPSSGPTGSAFTFAYRCTGVSQLSVVTNNGSPATGVTVGLAVSGNGVDYTQAVTPSAEGTYRGVLSCGTQSVQSSLFSASQFKYVALGDSYSAGEGVSPFFDPTNRCHRSQKAYSVKVEQPGVAGSSIYARMNVNHELGLAWGFQACSGAVVASMLTEGHHGDPLPQLQLDRASDLYNPLDLPVDASSDLVTLTVGGNDVDFAKIIELCGLRKDCENQQVHYNRNTEEMCFRDPCSRSEFPQRGKLSEYVDFLLDRLPKKLDAVYARINTQAPQARVLVLGYPHQFPAKRAEQKCTSLLEKKVPRGFLGSDGSLLFSLDEQNYLRGAADRLNALIARRVRAAGQAEFVRVDALFAGHEICGSAGPWLNGVSYTVGTGGPGKLDDGSFHPNSCGQDAFAVLINLRLNGSLRDVSCQ